MQFSNSNYDAATVTLMGRACDAAWHELRAKVFFPSLADERDIRHLIALRVMTAVADGERDLERLKAAGLDTIEG